MGLVLCCGRIDLVSYFTYIQVCFFLRFFRFDAALMARVFLFELVSIGLISQVRQANHTSLDLGRDNLKSKYDLNKEKYYF